MSNAMLALSSAALTLLLSAPPPALDGRSLERRYLSTRDEYVRKLEKQEAAADDKAKIGRLFEDHTRALNELEKLLRGIVGPVNVAGIEGSGEINLETLLRSDVGYGLLDGVRFRWGDDWLLVTTRGLVEAYAASDTKLPKDLVALAQSAAFYEGGAMSDCAITHFMELPVAPAGSTSLVRAYLAAAWQEVGPWPPDFILVFAARGDRVFVVTSPLKQQAEQIPACEARWNEFEAKYDEARRPRGPERAGEQPDAHPERFRDEGFEAYRRCYASELVTRLSFVELTRRAQGIIERLEKPSP